MRDIIIDLGRPFGTPGELPEFVLADILGDNKIRLVQRTHHEEFTTAMLHYAEQLRAERLQAEAKE
jgi:hypothetical protein